MQPLFLDFVGIHLDIGCNDFAYQLQILDGIQMEIDSPIGCLDGKNLLIPVVNSASDYLVRNLWVSIGCNASSFKKH